MINHQRHMTSGVQMRKIADAVRKVLHDSDGTEMFFKGRSNA